MTGSQSFGKARKVENRPTGKPVVMAKNRTTSTPISAAERLAHVQAEIAELNIPLPPHEHIDADIDDLTQQLVDREHRKLALALIIPALERAAIEERRPDILSRKQIEFKALQRATTKAREVQARYDAVNAEWVKANTEQIDAQDRFNYVAGEVNRLDVELRVHDERHAPTPPPAAPRPLEYSLATGTYGPPVG